MGDENAETERIGTDGSESPPAKRGRRNGG